MELLPGIIGQMKRLRVMLLGRPNVGKSTLVNSIIGTKVAITSPKPQTTRFPIEAKYIDERGEIIFVDTPGVFRKAKDALSRSINKQTLQAFGSEIDVAVYVLDHSREKDFEEARVLGIFRQLKCPKILFFNKMDILKPSFLAQYDYIKEDVPEGNVVMGSALKRTHLKSLIQKIFDQDAGEEYEDAPNELSSNEYVSPILNLDSKTWLAELIREKVFLNTRQELPYATNVEVDEVIERDDGVLYVKGRIITTTDVYRQMLIGAGGRRIKAIGMAARKELELSTAKKVYVDLFVEVDKHWIEKF